MNDKYVVVIGGLNIDLAGLSGPDYREHDSNIGTVTMNVGGVGQNIAHNLTNLGVPVYLISVYGDDHFGNVAELECRKNGIRLDYAQKIPGAHSSIYLYINNGSGDMVTAINDMKITEHITPEFLSRRLNVINSAAIVVLDANLMKETLDWIGEHVTAPLFVDTVSAAKACRVSGILSQIDTIKPNALEAQLLTGIKVTDEVSAKAAAQKLLDAGVKNVFISLGKDGILCMNHQESIVCRPMVKQVVNTNGAGDATMATLVWTRYYYGDQLSIEKVGIFTQAASSFCLESNESVAPELSAINVMNRAEKYFE